MTTINQNTFLNQFRHGIDLENAELNAIINKSNLGEDFLNALDKNNDQQLTGNELREAFRQLDEFDRNGSADSFDDKGTSGNIYCAFSAGANADYGAAISKSAIARANADSEGYAFDNAPTSPFENLSGNTRPGVTRPGWLKNQNKCNQFVGDALTAVGVKMPTFTMADDSEHYMSAEKLPSQSDYFDRIISKDDIQVGHVVVVDYPGSGESTAHTEIVTGVEPLRTTGAHADGAYEKNWSNLFDGGTMNADEGCWETPDGNKIYILRPTNKE